MRSREATSSPRTVARIGATISCIAAAIVYFITVDPAISFWDCPEYALTAYRLEIGHSPGNPAWTLFHNVAARLADAIAGPGYVARTLNLCSGLFTALAVGLLFRICFFTIRYVAPGRQESHPLPAAFASLCASLIFAWSDSPWFSAVETEVYAMSLFFTALTVWLMIRWARTRHAARRSRLLILISYLTGLSIGVHELNLLAIPALALIYIFRRKRGPCPGKAWTSLALSVVILACLLLGMYPGTSTIAGEFELFAVNRLGMPFGSGVIIYLCVLLTVGICAPLSLSSYRNKGFLPLQFLLLFSLILLGGFLLFSRHFTAAVVLSLVLTGLMLRKARRHRRAIITATWMMTFTLLGFGVYILIPLRSAANPPVNENAPDNVFSFYSYLKRDQYGKRPLFYGPTPYAKPIYRETFDTAGNPVYATLVRRPYRPVYAKAMPGARLSGLSGLRTPADSLANAKADSACRKGQDRYLLSDYRYDIEYTPELYMLFPRLTSHNPTDISNYESWAGMTKESMTETQASFALDSLGQPVGRLFSDGKREKEKMLKPTWIHNLRELFGYQIAYMYFRYLLWNFSGRQNDYPSAGEIEHGNFITGFAPADDLILGDRNLLPPELGSENEGRNPYFMIPFILGVAGAIVALRRGRRGKRADAVILTLFLMTGVAIVVYLNQDPGEPRERDYSFLGSFLAFSVWISLALSALCGAFMRLKKRWPRHMVSARCVTAAAFLLMAAVPVWMLAVNFKDHDRSYRYATTDFAYNILESLDRDAIIFVDGDNFTFPLWYAQEVLGIRRDVTVINISYLSTSWYVRQLMQPGEESRPVEMQARPEDVAYGAFSVLRLPSSLASDSTQSVDAIGEIRRLYASRENVPRFSTDWLRLPTARGDTMLINLRTALGGSTAYTQRELAMIDIVATNALSGNPRPVYWQAALVSKQTAGLEPYTSRTLYARKLTPGKERSDSAAYLTDEALRFLPRVRSGATDTPGVYLDPYVGTQVSHQRLNLLRLADALMKKGDYRNALRTARISDSLFPESAWPYQGVVPQNGTVWQEGLKLAEIYIEAGKATGDHQAVAAGEALRERQLKRIRRWKKWYGSLPAWQKTTVSRESRRIINADI